MRALQFFAAPIFCLQLVAAFRSSALDFKGVTEPPEAVTCAVGNTDESGCLSMCRRLGLTASSENGQCEDFVEKLKAKGYQKFFGSREPSLEPIVKTLKTNCKEEEFVFFLEVILKFIDKTPEETRDEKYAEDFKDLKKRVIDALKKKDPDYEVDLASCQDGDTAITGCRSVCRWLGLTESTTNGQCEDYVETLLGYKKKGKWKFWGHESSMTPVLELLSTNCRKEELGYYFAGIIQLIERMPENKKEKYKEQLKKLQDLVSDQLTNEVAAVEEEEYEDDDVPLPTCETGMTIEEGDIVTWENYGPNFEEASGMIGDYKNKHFEYKLRMSYGSRMNYSKIPFNTSTNTSWNNRTLGSKAKRFLVLSAKYCGNAFFKVGQAFADAGINTFLGIADLGLLLGTVMARGAFWTGERMTTIYANQRQTTEHTAKSIKFTHTELGVGKNRLTTAGGRGVGSFPLCYRGISQRKGHVVISRFVGDGTVDAQKYRKLAAQRALMWEPYLNHYSDTVGQWYRSVVGKCLNILGTPGNSDYFEAVTPEVVKEMWDYTPSFEDSERSFLKAIQDSFRTYKKVEGKSERVKPKAMFCSKFVSAIWSSTIGNPTNDPNATVRSRDLKIMLPFNPGSCSPWTIVQWIVSKSGRKSWKSCVGDLAPGKFNPCDIDNY